MKFILELFIMAFGLGGIAWFFPNAMYWVLGAFLLVSLIAIIQPFVPFGRRWQTVSYAVMAIPAFLLALNFHQSEVTETARLDALRNKHPEQYQKELADKATAEIEAERAIQCGKGNYLGAVVRAQHYVKKALKSPSTASFPFSSKGITTVLDDCTFRVTSHVDAQNSFGATARSYYSVVVKNNYPDESWSLIEITIQ